ncbi:LysR family transcriptional regulator [Alisedimentitalea sp. MJ-SS2]|uniref:LysR family transcriptional regulator n=1 Tax=Aliisedimentitalea sp. MJ-SS2 TaxID=3049795 RepID=UPI0029094A04|nr:LysR family transcriptional regulator [Alisedimentitalea sp. MJ-SS2]MDU8927415.1 LysR family transcriptional regulator [Alisedimentitalea sp. MJ-SS2]
MPRRLPNLKQLRAFEATARHQSFKLAAEELAVTQAAISHQIKALEEYFGCRLFKRLNRRVVLTEAAANYAEELGQALGGIEAASNWFRSQEMRGAIRLSVTPFYANRMILPFLDEFRDRYPGLEVEFDYSYKIADFEAAGLDGAVRYGLHDPANPCMRLIHLDRVAPVASPTLVQDDWLPVHPETIARMPLAAVNDQERYWHQWFKAAGVAEQDDRDWSRHKQRALALDYALAGNAVVLADMPLIRRELEAGSLVCLSGVQITLDRGIHLAVTTASFTDARLVAFGDWLGAQVARFSDADQETSHAEP